MKNGTAPAVAGDKPVFSYVKNGTIYATEPAIAPQHDLKQLTRTVPSVRESSATAGHSRVQTVEWSTPLGPRKDRQKS